MFESKYHVCVTQFANIIFVVLVMGCIDYFPLETKDGSRMLTVDALISTAQGPHTVRLTYANKYTDLKEGTTITVNGALVSIIDNLGNKHFLEEEIIKEQFWCDRRGWFSQSVITRTGIYKTTSTFEVDLSRKYMLQIDINGNTYTSSYESVAQVPSLDSVSFVPFKTPTLNPLIFNSGFTFMAHFKDPLESDNYYLWKLSNIDYALVTQPHLYLLPTDHSTCPKCPTPKTCCDVCYLNDVKLQGLFNVENDFLFDGLEPVLPILKIEDDGLRFNKRFRSTIEQYNISQDAFRYFSLIKQQLEIKGSVFDPPPARITGNIQNIENEEETVLGYFLVADVSSYVVYINREDLPNSHRQVQALIPDDCRQYCETRRPLSTVPPQDWKYN